jgi:predicted homoserine dehydrogenase-like protein
MNLNQLLAERRDRGRPVRILMIGAGKFGSMFLAQARLQPGFHVAALADLDPARAKQSLAATGWSQEQGEAKSVDAAVRSGTTFVTDDAMAVVEAGEIEVVIDATGNPAAGLRHARAAIANGKHIVMVNVEADVLAGPLLAAEARKAGVVYSMAYGDQPALIAEMVDWARTCGFEVTAAGKGTKYLPEYHQSTPDTIWGYYGITAEQAAKAGMNPQMFNSFLDGTKSAIEMAAVSNACGLKPAPGGLNFPPCGVHDLPRVLRPAADGGVLSGNGQVEVISCMERDGRAVVGDLRWGVYVVFEAPSEYAANCFREYGLVTDPSGRYAAMWKPFHLIGLELGVSVASAACRGEPTGQSSGFAGDAVAVAKKHLGSGEVLDGEGGFTVWGRLMPAADSLDQGALPIGLAHKRKLVREVPQGQVLTWADVSVDDADDAYRIRREMEAAFGGARERAAE